MLEKNLDCLDVAIGSNLDIKDKSGENSIRKEESCRESFYHLREYRDDDKQNVIEI